MNSCIMYRDCRARVDSSIPWNLERYYGMLLNKSLLFAAGMLRLLGHQLLESCRRACLSLHDPGFHFFLFDFPFDSPSVGQYPLKPYTKNDSFHSLCVHYPDLRVPIYTTYTKVFGDSFLLLFRYANINPGFCDFAQVFGAIMLKSTLARKT